MTSQKSQRIKQEQKIAKIRHMVRTANTERGARAVRWFWHLLKSTQCWPTTLGSPLLYFIKPPGDRCSTQTSYGDRDVCVSLLS